MNKTFIFFGIVSGISAIIQWAYDGPSLEVGNAFMIALIMLKMGNNDQ